MSIAGVVAAGLLLTAARAGAVDPEAFIKANGYQSVKVSPEDGKTKFYRHTRRTTLAEVESHEKRVAALPKDERVLQTCELMRGGVKAQLIQTTGEAIDVAVVNYGYDGSTIACTLKYMNGVQVGTQVFYMKSNAAGDVYSLFIVE